MFFECVFYGSLLALVSWGAYSVWYVLEIPMGWSKKRVFTRWNDTERRAIGELARYAAAFVCGGIAHSSKQAFDSRVRVWDSHSRVWKWQAPDGCIVDFDTAIKAWSVVR